MAADALEVVMRPDQTGRYRQSKLRKSEHLVALSAQLAARVAVYRAWRKPESAGHARQELGIAEAEARRILDPRYGTKLDRIEAALAALGHRLIIDAEPVKAMRHECGMH